MNRALRTALAAIAAVLTIAALAARKETDELKLAQAYAEKHARKEVAA